MQPTSVRIWADNNDLGQFVGGFETQMFSRAHRAINNSIALTRKPVTITGVINFGDESVPFDYLATENDHPRQIERGILKSWFLSRDTRIATHYLGYDEIQLSFLKREFGIK